MLDAAPDPRHLTHPCMTHPCMSLDLGFDSLHVFQVVTNPIVFMTALGVICNVIFDHQLPRMIAGPFTIFADAFSAGALGLPPLPPQRPTPPYPSPGGRAVFEVYLTGVWHFSPSTCHQSTVFNINFLLFLSPSCLSLPLSSPLFLSGCPAGCVCGQARW